MISILTSIKLSGIQICKSLKNPRAKTLIKPYFKPCLQNKSGDIIKPMDCIANTIFIENLSKCNSIYKLYSEEEEYGININSSGEYIVAFDPLDGSDNIDINNPTGSLFCIFKKEEICGKNIIASGYIYYGNTLQLVIAMGGVVNMYNYSDVVDMFVHENSEFYDDTMDLPKIKIPYSGTTYSNNDGNNYKMYNSKIKDFIDVMMWTKNLRYSGCLVADLHRLLFRGGCFIYPENNKDRYGKIRLLYEAYPAAHIIETAGGFSRFDDTTASILDIRLNDIHQKTPIILMSNSEKEIYDSLK